MKTIQIISFIVAVLHIGVLQSATLCSGNSSAAAIDLTNGTRVAAATETIRYSAAWETTASGATAVVAVNETTLKSATGTGSVAWKPTQNGTYTLTHKVMNGTTQVGSTLSATFKVTGFPEETQTTEVPVPFAWLKAKYPELTDAASCEAKAMAIAANGVNTVWECYVIGLEPTAADARFVASIEMVEGVP